MPGRSSDEPTRLVSKVAHMGTIAEAAAAALSAMTGSAPPSVAVVLGSGWTDAADQFGEPTAEVSMADLPGFAPPSALGHAGTIRTVTVGDTQVLLLLGRTHAYEGHELSSVVHPVRTAIAAGADTVILTNAAGGIREDYTVGQPVLISDHLNLTARSPLVGAEFVDLVDAYSPNSERSPAPSTPNWSKACTPDCQGPITKRRPKSECCVPSAPTSWACRLSTRPSRPVRWGHACWASRWSPILRRASPAHHSITRKCSRQARLPPPEWERCCANWSANCEPSGTGVDQLRSRPRDAARTRIALRT